MKKIILLGILVLCALSVLAYTPPLGNQIELILETPYTPPLGNQIELQLIDTGISNPCAYDGNGDWEIDLTENCDVGTIDLLGNNFNMTGIGTFKGNLTNYKYYTIKSTDYDVWFSK